MDDELGRKITIVVPTFNRYPFLRRLLRHYISRGPSISMRILDSSDAQQCDPELKKLVESVGAAYSYYPPTISPIDKLNSGLSDVLTPYAVIWADDDFLVPRALKACVAFLESNQDYSAAHGIAGLFQVEASNDSPSISAAGPYLQTSILANKASGRFRKWFAGGGTVFYSVQRTEALKDGLAEWKDRGFGNMLGELLHGSMTVINGKTKQLDCLYMMREVHAGQTALTDAVASDIFDRVVSRSFAGEYREFSELVSKALAEQDQIRLDDASEIVKEAFWRYLAKALTRKSQEKYGKGTARGPRSRIKTIPGAREAWTWLTWLAPRSSLSLPALLSPRSPYHEDFMPMYNAVQSMSEHLGSEQEVSSR